MSACKTFAAVNPEYRAAYLADAALEKARQAPLRDAAAILRTHAKYTTNKTLAALCRRRANQITALYDRLSKDQGAIRTGGV